MKNQLTKDQSIAAIVETAVEKHGSNYDAFIPILLEVNQALGYIPLQALKEIRLRVRAPEDGVYVNEGRLYSLTSFYHMLSAKPRGRHVVIFCESAPCHVVGGRQVWRALRENLGLKAGETSEDGKWSLVTTSCLGACGVGPVVVVDDAMYGNVTPEQIPEILARYE
jgi:NADH:ubiquinone oxidoreductase subunit E